MPGSGYTERNLELTTRTINWLGKLGSWNPTIVRGLIFSKSFWSTRRLDGC